MLKIWGRQSAFNVQKVMWLMAELGLPYEHVPAGGKFGLLDTPAFLAMNPHGRIPVIEDAGAYLWESHSIMRYLAACYGKPQFFSDDPKERARQEAWMDWMQTTLQPDFLNGVFWGFYRTPAEQRNNSAIEESLKRCSKHFMLLDRQLAGQPFLGGNSLTLADIAVGAILYRYFEVDIPRPVIPHVQAWYARLQQRPAYQEHIMISFSDMFGRLDY